MPPIAKISLPCTVRALEEAVRSFCEQHGCYDTAMVRPILLKDAYSFDHVIHLVVTIPNEGNL